MAKHVGCWNGLAKRIADQDFGPDLAPMKQGSSLADATDHPRWRAW
ncbi:hypothetical protein [Propionibacterium sp.]